MLIGCNSLSFATDRSDKDAIRMLAKSGFDSVDYNLNKYSVRDPLSSFWSMSEDEHLAYASELKCVADENGMIIGQVHSPYPTYFPDNDKKKQVLEIQKRAIQIAGALGSPYIVVHPNVPPEAVTALQVEKAIEDNFGYYKCLFEDLKRANVKLGIENMFNWDRSVDVPLPTVASTSDCMAYMVDTLNNMCGENLFVACLDIGHAMLTGGGDPARMIDVLGSRLELLHIHDNDGKRDRHYIPFSGIINWGSVSKALVRNGYKGVLSLEIKTDGTEADTAFAAAEKLNKLIEKELYL